MSEKSRNEEKEKELSLGKTDEENDAESKNNTAEGEDTPQENRPSEADNEEADEKEAEPKPVLPRKRKITKNIQLYVSCGVVICAVLTLIVWSLFFDQNIIGEWHYNAEGSYTETSDDPEAAESADDASETKEYNESITYEFTDDGVCRVTLGSMTLEGTYQLASTKDDGNLMSVNVVYNYSPVFYGTYVYKVKGNPFTGKKLVLTDRYSSSEDQILEEGAAEDLLVPFENGELDENLTGEWYDPVNEITYQFTPDGYMIRSTSDGFTIRNVYTVMSEGVLLVTYYSDKEQSDTLSYQYNDGVLAIDGYELTKISG